MVLDSSKCLKKFAADNHLLLTDLNRLSDTFTFCSEANSSTSWLDHILCSSDMDSSVVQCSVHYDYVSSDHKPLVVTFSGIYPSCDKMLIQDKCKPDVIGNTVPDWSRVDDHCISRYEIHLDSLLRKLSIPVVYESHNIAEITEIIECYYEAVIACIHAACAESLPCKNKSDPYTYVYFTTKVVVRHNRQTD